MATDIRSIYARDTYIGSICAVGTWIRCTSVRGAYTGCIYVRSAFARGVKPKILAGSEVILAGPDVNNCYLMELVFASINGVSC